MNETTTTAQDSFEALATDSLTVTRRGESRTYHFTELTEEQMQAVLSEGDAKAFGTRLVLATVRDHDGQPMTLDRFMKLPASLSTKIRLRALAVNGEGEEAEKAGEA